MHGNVPILTVLPRHGQPIEYLTDVASPLVWETPKISILQASLCKMILSSCGIKAQLFATFGSHSVPLLCDHNIWDPCSLQWSTFLGITIASVLLMAISETSDHAEKRWLAFMGGHLTGDAALAKPKLLNETEMWFFVYLVINLFTTAYHYWSVVVSLLGNFTC